MRPLPSLACSLLVLVASTALGACIDAPFPESPPAARVVTAWDPRACEGSHRVVVELEDDFGAQVSGSTPCTHASVTLPVAHFGIYRGRVYAWELDADPPIRSELPVQLTVDEPVVRWIVPTPR